MNRIGWIVAGLAFVGAVLLVVLSQQGKTFDPDYRVSSKQPYGSTLFVEWLQDQKKSVMISDVSLKELADSTHKPVSLIITCDRMYPDSLTLAALAQLLNRGSTVIISAGMFSDDFLVRYDLHDAFLYDNVLPAYDARNTSQPLTDTSLAPGISYYLMEQGYADPYTVTSEGNDESITYPAASPSDNASTDTVIWHSIIVGNRPEHVVLAARTSFGAGQLILCTAPQFFTNYGMLHDNLWKATEVLVGFIPSDTIVWDEHYKPQPDYEQQMSRLTLIEQHRGLSLAYWILLSGTGLYLLVAARRRQRAIPSISIVKNLATEFISNITALYWLRRDNADVANRMIMQYRKQLVRRYRINDISNTESLAQQITALTGAPIEVVRRLLALCQSPLPKELSDEQLLAIGQDIESFFHHTNQ